MWHLIEQGHPAARAIYWHEIQELETYRSLSVRNPLRLRPLSASYWKAHAYASWAEAQYWAGWAAAEGRTIGAEAMLHAHPIRGSDERQRIVTTLRELWQVEVVEPPIMQLNAARRFYAEKELTRQEIDQWLSR
jgi:hypothetical protein